MANDNASPRTALLQDARAHSLIGNEKGAEKLRKTAEMTVSPATSSTSTNRSNDNLVLEVQEEIRATDSARGPSYRREDGSVDRSSISILKFPMDIEERKVPHIIFTVYETVTGAANTSAQGNLSSSIRSGVGQLAGAASTGVDALQEVSVTAKRVTDGAVNLVNEVGAKAGFNNIVQQTKSAFSNFAINRNYDMSPVAIALFMPDGVQTSYEQDFETLSLTSVLGGAGFLAQAVAADKGNVEETDPLLIELASRAVDKIGLLQTSEDVTNLLTFSTTGKVINPQFEMLYKSPKLRSFTFDFRLVPRNAIESGMIDGILKTFKAYSAPTIKAGTSGRYMIPPARFQFEFYDGDQSINTYLFKSKQCVLESMAVDFAPSGYASHRDGSPVEVRLQLIFRETTIISSEDARLGY